MGLFQSILESADGGAFVNLRDASGTGITSTLISSKQALDVNIAGGSISMGSADEASFTYGTSTYQPIGGVFSSSITNLTTGQGGVVNLTAFRDMRVNLRTSAGVELGNTSGTAIFVQNASNVSTTGTITQAAAGTSSFTILASNTGRKLFSIYNPLLFTIFVSMAATSSLTAFTTALRPNTFYEPQNGVIYNGIITGIGPAGTTGNLQVTEYT